MNIEALESFVLLAENKNFTKTAEMQYVVQATISNRINELEKSVGKELFLRDNKNVSLTKAGKNFLPYAKRILMLKKEGIIKARSTGIYDDRLSLGTVDCIYDVLISPMLKDYFKKYPNIAVKLKLNHSDEIIRLLGDEILDIGFVYHRPKQLKFDVSLFLKDEIILVTSYQNNFNIEDEVNSRDLLKLPLLYVDLGPVFFKWLVEQLGDRPLLRLSVDHISSVVDYVKDGLGCGFVPRSTVEKELAGKELKIIKIKDVKPPERKIYMLINKGKKDSLALRKWIKMIKSFKKGKTNGQIK